MGRRVGESASRALAIGAMALSTFGPAIATFAADAPEAAAHPLVGNEITEREVTTVRDGLEALAKKQAANGSFSNNHVGITALAAMAFMQAGNLPGRGKYGLIVEKALNFVLASSQESGLICADTYSSPMYGHGFATLFLAEVFGMTGDERVKEKLQKAIKLIHKSQNDQGGWRYQPAPVDADISVTILQVMALRAARDAGIKVEKDTIDHAIKYVKACQNADGGYSYMLGEGGMGSSGLARTGAGTATLFYAGIYADKSIDKGIAYIRKNGKARGLGSAADNEGNYYYCHYYCVQAMYLQGGKDWADWYPQIREDLIKRQTGNKLWSGDNTEEYATAMALLILQMPNRYLPVYSGKGPGS